MPNTSQREEIDMIRTLAAALLATSMLTAPVFAAGPTDAPKNAQATPDKTTAKSTAQSTNTATTTVKKVRKHARVHHSKTVHHAKKSPQPSTKLKSSATRHVGTTGAGSVETKAPVKQ
jgi:hypothetical protein